MTYTSSDRCGALRRDGQPCRGRILRRSEDYRCRMHTRQLGPARPSPKGEARRANGMPGWFVGPARELLGLSPAGLASQLGVAEEVVTAWEADERPLPARKFGPLLRLLDAHQRRAFVDRTFAPLLEAKFGLNFRESVLSDVPKQTRSVGTPSDTDSAPPEST